MSIYVKDWAEAKEYVKEHIEDYLASTNRPLTRNFNCPNTAYHKHGDKSPSMSYDKRRRVCRCHTENTDFDTIDLIKCDYGITDNKEAFIKAYELYDIKIEGKGEYQMQDRTEQKHITVDVPTHTHIEDEPETELDLTQQMLKYHQLFMELKQTDEHRLHYAKRGLDLDIIEEYKLGYAPEGYNSILEDYPEHQSKSSKQEHYVYVLPHLTPEGRCDYITTEISDRANTDAQNGKYRKISKGDTNLKAKLFNERYIKGNTPDSVFICEGIYDALSVESVGGKAIAMQGVGYKRLLDLCKEYQPDCVFIINLDNDKAGQTTVPKLVEGFKELKMQYIVAPTTAEGKDDNDYYLEDYDSFTNYVETLKDDAEALKHKERDEYLKTSVATELEGFIDKVTQTARQPVYPTGFKALDDMLGGGLYSGLYFIGAISSLGKTTFCVQVADQLAQQGYDVLFFSLETPKLELISKSISRHTAIMDENRTGDTRHAKSTRGIMNGNLYPYDNETMLTILDAIEEYKSYADNHIFIHYGLGSIGVEDIRKAVERHVHFTGNKPVVFIDYIQILKPTEKGLTDKEKTDINVVSLKALAVEYGIPVVGISSFNRENYVAPVNMASFKESGAVEYSSDVLIGLQYEGMDYVQGEKQTERDTRIRDMIRTNEEAGRAGGRQQLQLKILKQRLGAKGSTYLDFYPVFNLYKERVQPANDDWA